MVRNPRRWHDSSQCSQEGAPRPRYLFWLCLGYGGRAPTPLALWHSRHPPFDRKRSPLSFTISLNLRHKDTKLTPYFRKSGRVADCACLENRKPCKGLVGSNPTSSECK